MCGTTYNLGQYLTICTNESSLCKRRKPLHTGMTRRVKHGGGVFIARHSCRQSSDKSKRLQNIDNIWPPTPACQVLKTASAGALRNGLTHRASMTNRCNSRGKPLNFTGEGGGNPGVRSPLPRTKFCGEPLRGFTPSEVSESGPSGPNPGHRCGQWTHDLISLVLNFEVESRCLHRIVTSARKPVWMKTFWHLRHIFRDKISF